ncbi:MAG: hypothetical protein WBA74_00595, partial [Cyclobacteriaceae bacterium]
TRMMIRIDSIPSNNTKYWYRVRGIDSFGEVGPPSDTVSGSGKPLFAFNSEIISHEVNNAGQVAVSWTFPEEGSNMLKGFDLLRFDQRTKTYSVVAEDINSSARIYRDETPRATNYYVISSKDNYGRRNNSFPYLVQLEDSIAPGKPMGFKGEIAADGQVKLSWNENPENDVSGYKLYRANFANAQFIALPGEIIEGTTYVDTISLGTLTETIFYKLQALDYRYNPSELSEPLELKKPDLIPPNSPVFTAVKADSAGVLLDWEFSSSEDVVEYLLYKKSEDDARWGLIRTIPAIASESFFLDESVVHRKAYAYTMVAVDDAGIESEPAPPVSIKWRSRSPYPAIDNLYYNVSQEEREIAVSWSYNQPNVSKYKIYKSINGRPFTLVKTVTGDTTEWKDEFSINEEQVSYRIVAAFTNGDSSEFSKILKVNF